MERTGRPNPHGNPKKFPRGKAPLDPAVNRQTRGGRKAHSPVEIAPKRLISTENGVNEHIRPRERKRSPGADPSDDPSIRKRDEWKASTRTEGDSKVPSASIATSTCRKAGARGKHTGNVKTTPGSVRGKRRDLNRHQVTVPKNRWARKTLPPLSATARAEAGQPQRLKEETTRWEEPLQLPVH